MTAGEMASIIGVIIIGLGLIGTWVRNGRSQGKQLGSLDTRMENLDKKLDDPNTGLGAIKNSVDNQAINCARITSSYSERIKTLEKASEKRR